LTLFNLVLHLLTDRCDKDITLREIQTRLQDWLCDSRTIPSTAHRREWVPGVICLTWSSIDSRISSCSVSVLTVLIDYARAIDRCSKQGGAAIPWVTKKFLTARPCC